MTITKQQEKVIIENSVRWTQEDIPWLKEAVTTIRNDGYEKVAQMLAKAIEEIKDDE